MTKIMAGLLLGLMSQAALANQNFGMAGCGLGSQAMGPEGSQVLAATTNGTGSQGFAISSGTSNCVTGDKAAMVRAQEQFFVNNLKILSKEMAQGEGEYVKAFAQTMGCNAAAQGEFAKEMQKSYGHIFSAPGAMSMLSRVRSSIHENTALNSNCNTVI